MTDMHILTVASESANLLVDRVGGARRSPLGEPGIPGCADVKSDTPPTTLVAPNGYMDSGSASTSVEDIRHYLIGRSNMIVTAGVDVGKASLDVSLSEGPVVRFDNTVKGIGKLLKYLKERGATMVVCEATGGYERLLVTRLRKTDLAVHVAHPTRVRAFAKACGFEAKTDPRDAQVLSRYGQVFPDAQTPELELAPEREVLRDLLARRRQFMQQRVQELGRLDKGTTSIATRSTKRHISWLEKEIARLDVEYKEALEKCIPLADRAALYRSVPGVGPLTSAILVAYLPELGSWDSKSLTSLVGLAPWSRDSGKKRGNRAIRGGRGSVRSALYLCAWSVIRHDSELRRFYRHLRQRGKPGNVAVMRKLLLQLNAVARRGTPWVPRSVPMTSS